MKAGADTLDDEIGFRTVEVRGTQILLNGKPVFLRGVSVHAEAPYRTGRAYGQTDADTLLGWVKELGGNYARLAHYPHDQPMTRTGSAFSSGPRFLSTGHASSITPPLSSRHRTSFAR